MIIILDFGSQTTHLIARRIKEKGVEVKILPHDIPCAQILAQSAGWRTKGIILSGGPASVYGENAPACDPQIFQSGIPILGICYGLQLLTHLLNGKVIKVKRREYGPATLLIANSKSLIASKLPRQFTVWMSHGDKVVKLPDGFETIGSTDNTPFAFVANLKRQIYGLQFHPEVAHTPQGTKILENFVFKICGCLGKINNQNLINELVMQTKKQVGDQKAVCALSGGIDSAVAAVLTHKAIGKSLTCFYVDTGFMRQGEAQQVARAFKSYFRLNFKVIRAQNLFLKKIIGVTNPEKKRKIIGATFIKIFEDEAKKLGASVLIQGTIYPDVIESGAPRRPDGQNDRGTKLSSKIKSHHNVGGLPKNHGFKIVEPLRSLYKDEVRNLAKKLNFPKELIFRQVFPGPGLAIRIIGEVTPKKLNILRKADGIVAEEIRQAKLNDKLWMAFAILTGVKTTAVMGDGRTYGETIAIRALESRDAMTADWARLPHPLLSKISSRVVNEVPGVSRVVYDITTKPPATMEWE